MPDLFTHVSRDDPAALFQEIEAGGDVNAVDAAMRTPLIQAAIDGKLRIVEILVSSGANVDWQDELGYSALHYAAQNFHPGVVALLLRNGATTEVVDSFGNTPLWRAVFDSQGRGEVIRLLLDAGANPDRRNKRGICPLDLARTISNYDILQFME